MKLYEVIYGDGIKVVLRDHHWEGKWLRGIPCNELGVADRFGCNDAELSIRADRVISMKELA